MSEKYGEDQPWHLTQEPDVAPSYEELEERIEELNKELSEANKRGDAWRFRADIAEVKLAKAVEALTPSGDTKAAYIAEVETDCPCGRPHTVSWTATKDIMKMIRDRAELKEEGRG
jgi:hypothetical protein